MTATLNHIQRKALGRMLRVDQAGEVGANYIYKAQLFHFPEDPTLIHMWDQEKVHLNTLDKVLGENRIRPSFLRPLWEVGGSLLGGLSAGLGGRRGAMACTEAVESVIGNHYNDQIRELLEMQQQEKDSLSSEESTKDSSLSSESSQSQSQESSKLMAGGGGGTSSEDFNNLIHLLQKFRDEELEHRLTAIQEQEGVVSSTVSSVIMEGGDGTGEVQSDNFSARGKEEGEEVGTERKSMVDRILYNIVKRGCQVAIRVAERI